jgi:hypothetical protein
MLHDDKKLPGEGRGLRAFDAFVGVPNSQQPELPDVGHEINAEKAIEQLPVARQTQSEEGHVHVADTGRKPRADLAPTIAAIRSHHRGRKFAMDQRKRVDQAIGAFLRTQFGWSKELPQKERDSIADRAAVLLKIGEAEVKQKPTAATDEAYAEYRGIIAASLASRAPWQIAEKAHAKEMERLVRSLPVWEWADGVRGFGAISLAVIVGEAGDLSAYPKKGHLWKRMGLAVIGTGDGVDDVRQGAPGKGAGADAWIEHGYNPSRRSQMFVIGDVLVKVGDTYRQVYLARKQDERAKAEARGLTVSPAAKIPKGRKDEFLSDMAVHRRAQRYMEKRLLRDLWQAWRRAGVLVP